MSPKFNKLNLPVHFRTLDRAFSTIYDKYSNAVMHRSLYTISLVDHSVAKGTQLKA